MIDGRGVASRSLTTRTLFFFALGVDQSLIFSYGKHGGYLIPGSLAGV